MEVFLVELREIHDPSEYMDEHWDMVTMYVGSTLDKALDYCVANVGELRDDTSCLSWYAICKHTVDLDDAVDGELVALYGKYGKLDNQPCYGYNEEYL